MVLRYFFRGYVKYKVKTEKPYRLINALKDETALRNLKILDENTVQFICFYNYHHAAEEKINSTADSIEYKKAYGLPHILHKYKKRYGIFAGIAFACAIILLSNMFVWRIQIEGNEVVDSKDIKRILNDVGFKEGDLKKEVDIDLVVNKYLIADDRISWMAINFEGTVAHVEVREARVGKRVQKKENVNLVSNADGIIVRVDALSGQSVVESSDVVSKGQLLVSSFVDKRTGGSSLRGAKGFVWARTNRSYCVTVPIFYNSIAAEEKVQKKYVLTIFGSVINLGGKSNTEHDIKLKSSLIAPNNKLPFEIVKRELVQYESLTLRRSENEALELARAISKKRLENATDNFTLIDKSEDYSIEGDLLIYVCTYDGIENIATELEFNVT